MMINLREEKNYYQEIKFRVVESVVMAPVDGVREMGVGHLPCYVCR